MRDTTVSSLNPPHEIIILLNEIHNKIMIILLYDFCTFFIIIEL